MQKRTSGTHVEAITILVILIIIIKIIIVIALLVGKVVVEVE